jgi:hypothetical protein
MNYLEHERTFPNRRANAGPDQTCYGLSDLPREGALLHAPAEGHPQVLIIAHAVISSESEIRGGLLDLRGRPDLRGELD